MRSFFVQGACQVGPDNPMGMCTLVICHDGFQINQGSGAAAPEDSRKLLLSKIRMRQTRTSLQSSGRGLRLASNKQLWLQNAVLEGITVCPRLRGIVLEPGIVVYTEGTFLLLSIAPFLDQPSNCSKHQLQRAGFRPRPGTETQVY